MPRAKSDSPAALLRALAKEHPDATCSLDFETPLQLLVATILSAQCTDARVNMVTPALFKRFGSARAFADADLDELRELIRSTGFFNNKAKAIQAACAQIVDERQKLWLLATTGPQPPFPYAHLEPELSIVSITRLNSASAASEETYPT